MWVDDEPSAEVLDTLFDMIHQGGSVFSFGSRRVIDVIGAGWKFFKEKNEAVSVDEIYGIVSKYCHPNKEFDLLYQRYQNIIAQESRL